MRIAIHREQGETPGVARGSWGEPSDADDYVAEHHAHLWADQGKYCNDNRYDQNKYECIFEQTLTFLSVANAHFITSFSKAVRFHINHTWQ